MFDYARWPDKIGVSPILGDYWLSKVPLIFLIVIVFFIFLLELELVYRLVLFQGFSHNICIFVSFLDFRSTCFV